MRPVSAWGRLSADLHHVEPLTNPWSLQETLRNRKRWGLPHGMGRSYGDVCLNPGGSLWLTTSLDRFQSFDEKTGRLRVEAGVLLRDIQKAFIPRGWILPVTPGTQMATVGGAIANDVHGKNHHLQGSFGDHVSKIQLARTDGDTQTLSLDENPECFRATLGGLGLTGLITAAEIQLKPVSGPWLESETLPFHGLESFFSFADASEADWEHTVAWIDCLSGINTRGLFMRAKPARAGDKGKLHKKRSRKIPVVPPVSLVNALTLRPFNEAYFRLGQVNQGSKIVDYIPFFYPLDNLLEWNRMYGPKGFYQYQSVVPREVGLDATKAMLQAITQSGEGSFLAVLKTFGEREAPGLLSFPRPGVTLALDFPNRGDRTHRLFERLDSIVREARGTLYPAKDARMPRDLFEAGYPHLETFSKHRDPGISSAFSRRVMDF
jgi:FAD/FMN-containing dehydrogenase